MAAVLCSFYVSIRRNYFDPIIRRVTLRVLPLTTGDICRQSQADGDEPMEDDAGEDGEPADDSAGDDDEMEEFGGETGRMTPDRSRRVGVCQYVMPALEVFGSVQEIVSCNVFFVFLGARFSNLCNQWAVSDPMDPRFLFYHDFPSLLCNNVPNRSPSLLRYVLCSVVDYYWCVRLAVCSCLTTQHAPSADNVRVKEAERRRKDKKLGRRQAQLDAEAAEAAAFFSEATGDALGAAKTFHEMNLSRPLLKVRGTLHSHNM